MAKTYKITYSAKTAYRGDGNDLYPNTDLDGYYAGKGPSYNYGTYCQFSGLSSISESTVTAITLHLQRLATGVLSSDITYGVALYSSVLSSAPSTSDSNRIRTGYEQFTTNRVQSNWVGDTSDTGGEYREITISTSLFAQLKSNGWCIAHKDQERKINIGDVYLTVTTSETDYTLSYNANGGSGAPASQKVTGVGSATATISSTTPTRTGYNFNGWATSASGSAIYQPGGSITISKNTTLYAVWQEKTYTVSYNKGANGTGTNTTATKTYGVVLTLKGAIFTRTGYTQTGWATSDGGSKAYELSGSYTANKAVTLYPFWTAKTYSVTFNANGGTVSTTSKTVTYGQTYGTLPTPTRIGYKFDGWFTEASGGTQVKSSTTVSITANQTLYAHWTVQSIIRVQTETGLKIAQVYGMTETGIKLGIVYEQTENGLKQSS